MKLIEIGIIKYEYAVFITTTSTIESLYNPILFKNNKEVS